jgi:hypothetical protein
MPVTYQLISSNVLSSSAASVTFSAIPATYTDLVVRASIRTDRSNSNYGNLIFTLNSDTSALYSFTWISGQSTTAASSRTTGRTINDQLNTSLSTSNTFNSMEIYLPSYAASQSKPLSIITALENNTTNNNNNQATAFLYRSNTAISNIKLEGDSENFVSGSSFYLYGIKNS